MEEFLDWANGEQQIDPIIKAAIVALWFVTVHPFGDGNGRLSRTLTDLFLTRSDGMTHRFYSMSAAICKNRMAYYDILEKTQKGGMDVTPWIVWFLSCLDEALQHTEVIIAKVLEKSTFWEQHKDIDVNERQRKIIDRLLEGFDETDVEGYVSRLYHGTGEMRGHEGRHGGQAEACNHDGKTTEQGALIAVTVHPAGAYAATYRIGKEPGEGNQGGESVLEVTDI